MTLPWIASEIPPWISTVTLPLNSFAFLIDFLPWVLPWNFSIFFLDVYQSFFFWHSLVSPVFHSEVFFHVFTRFFGVLSRFIWIISGISTRIPSSDCRDMLPQFLAGLLAGFLQEHFFSKVPSGISLMVFRDSFSTVYSGCLRDFCRSSSKDFLHFYWISTWDFS